MRSSTLQTVKKDDSMTKIEKLPYSIPRKAEYFDIPAVKEKTVFDDIHKQYQQFN